MAFHPHQHAPTGQRTPKSPQIPKINNNWAAIPANQGLFTAAVVFWKFLTSESATGDLAVHHNVLCTLFHAHSATRALCKLHCKHSHLSLTCSRDCR